MVVVNLIYILREGERTGPFTVEEINRRLAAGRLHPADRAWSEDSPGWKPLLSFTGVLMPGAASSTAAPTSIAKPFQPPQRDFAAFSVRLSAALVDAVLLGVVVSLLVVLFPSSSEKMSILRNVVAALLCFFYMPLMWASGFEATLGQRLFGLKVMRTDGAPVSWWRALTRAFAVIISLAAFGLGFFAIAFSNRRLAWHDRLTDTRVKKTAN